jgi:photosystem II stability/assembly factor-like uncharacterized protein
MSSAPDRLSARFSIATASLLLLLTFAARGQSPAPSPVWTVQKSGTDASLRGVSAVDGSIAWASGSKGTVLRTVDGGKTWVRRPVPGADGLDFRDIEAFSADSARILAIGRPARIFATEDGGATWTETYTNDTPGIFLDAFAWFDAQTALVLGDPLDGRFFLLTSSFGGRIWSFMPLDCRPLAEKDEGAFAASGTCIRADARGDVWFVTGGSVARAFHSRDWGKTWTAKALPLLSGQASFGAYSIDFLDDKTGVVVGGDYRTEAAADRNAAWTADGGATWTPAADKRPAGFRECVAFSPGPGPRIAVTVGPSGSDLSTDAGRTWAPLPGPAGFHSLAFAPSPSGRTAWAVGKGGLIARLAY